MNLWNFVRHQQITISFYLCFCFLWGIFWLLKWLFNCPLDTSNCSAPCFFLFSRKIVYKLVDMALHIVFGRKRLEYATCGQVFVRKRRKESAFSKIKNTCGRYLCVVWKWSWWLCEIIEHCSLRKMQSVIKKNKRGKTKEISEAGLISRKAFILMYSKSV